MEWLQTNDTQCIQNAGAYLEKVMGNPGNLPIMFGILNKPCSKSVLKQGVNHLVGSATECASLQADDPSVLSRV